MDPERDLASVRPDQPKSFWARLSRWLQPWKRDTDHARDELIRRGDDAETPVGPGADLTWPRRRTGQISRLEEAFDKLVGLVDTIDRHIQHQADRSEQSVTQTRRIADALTQSQSLDRQRTESVEELTNQYRNQTRAMQQVAESVEALPRAIKQQSEQLAQIRDQLEAQLEAQLSTAQSIQQLASVSETLRSLAGEQRHHFERLHESSQAASMQIAQTLARQSRRFTLLVTLAISAAVLAAGGLIAALWAMARSLR
ncbi:MAG: hypothetical protein BIFFINMI_00445 [Phycisphaerae bacterium]|nr:hypothetical protein [Phycisphaerae bacterium]